VFDGITDPVVLLDNNARIKIVNAEFQKRNSVTLADVIHCSPLELKLNKCCPLQLCGDIFATMPDYPVTKEVKVATGEIFLIYFYPIQSTIGVVDNLICYVKDITEQKKLEIKIQQTEKLVSLGQLAAGIAHEINNPLGVILCHIDLLQDEGNLSDDAKADLAIIEKHAGNCRSIIADLLNFAHQQQTVKALGSIKTIITDVVTMVTPQFLKNHIEIVVKIDDELPLLYLDIDKIKQVILNLLINSSHAIGESGSIIISAAHDIKKSCCQIMIEDTGQGIPEEKIAKIFDPFFTTKPAGKGTGLGLSVSYGIINDHNGDIRAESEPGKNTCFIITLPTAEVTHE
jgi:signal transduction histidine kinase